jgi:hypothetical protein
VPHPHLPARRGTGRPRSHLLGAAQQRGTSVTYAAEQLAAEVIRSHRLPTPLVWIEHWPKEAMDDEEETFELVVFSSYKVEERTPYLGETRAWIGDATWRPLDRATVEVLVDGKV